MDKEDASHNIRCKSIRGSSSTALDDSTSENRVESSSLAAPNRASSENSKVEEKYRSSTDSVAQGDPQDVGSTQHE